MSRRSVGSALMFGGPLVAVFVAFIAGLGSFDIGVPSACGGNCEQRLAQEAAHRHALVLACLGFALISAIAGWLLRASVPDDSAGS